MTPRAAASRPTHHKVATGCSSCKRSHVKCNEARPACGRCIRLSKSCHYLPLRQPWIFTPRQRELPESNSRMGLEVSDTWSTSRALHIYRDWAVRVFAAYFGHDFWTRLVPQISHSSIVIRCAVVTTASALDSIRSHKEDPSTQIEIREKHRANVRSIINSAEQRDPEFVLIASLIFASCELVMGALDAGMLHLEAGSKILKERMDHLVRNDLKHSLAASLLSDDIVPIFAAYGQITSVYGVNLASLGEPSTTWAGQYDCVHIPTVFVTTDQACAHLKSTIHQIFMMNSSHSPAHLENLVTQLDQWATALDALEHFLDSNHPSHIVSSAICFLRIQYRLAKVFLSVACTGDERDPLLFERFSFDFIWILAQYDTMKFDQILADENVELIAPLFIIATKTRSKRISNEAVRLLGAMYRVEANWDSQTALRFAREIAPPDQCSSTSPARSSQSRENASWSSPKKCLHNASGIWPIGYILTMANHQAAGQMLFESRICKHLA